MHAQKRPEFHFQSNFNQKFETPLGCLLFDYKFWWRLLQDLDMFWAEKNWELVGWAWPFFDETPKRHSLGRFHMLWAICRADQFTGFYSASALLAMQSAVLARGILSVCPSVTFQYCVQTNEDMIVRFAASGRTIPLVSEEVKFIRIFARDHPQRGRL